MEIFKDVIGYDGIYQVSNLGRVKSLERKARNRHGWRLVKERFLKPVKTNGNVYFLVSLWKNSKQKTRRVHQLVAESFLNHTPDGCKLVVNHINFIKTDNRVENLEIITTRANTTKKHIKSSSKYVGVDWAKANNKWRSQIQINGNKKSLGYFTNELEAHKAYQKELKKITTL